MMTIVSAETPSSFCDPLCLPLSPLLVPAEAFAVRLLELESVVVVVFNATAVPLSVADEVAIVDVLAYVAVPFVLARDVEFVESDTVAFVLVTVELLAVPALWSCRALNCDNPCGITGKTYA